MEPYLDIVRARLLRPNTVQVCSDLTRLEARVMPLRCADEALLAEFDKYFADTVSHVIALSREVIDDATRVRAQYGFKTADAIHLAAAVHARCDVYLTNDHRLSRFSEITVKAVEARGADD